MQTFNGYIKIHRKLLEWGWYQDHVAKEVFLHLILTANFREKEWMGRMIGRGQTVTSYAGLAAELGFSVQQIRTAINKLKATGEITSEATNRYTIITIENWEKYQFEKEEATSETTAEATSDQQTDNKQTTNNQQHLKKDKNDKNINNKKKNIEKEKVKNKYGEYQNVLLTDEEMDKLRKEFPGDWAEWIERLSSYMASTGKTYKNHPATIRNWARKDKEKGEQKQTKYPYGNNKFCNYKPSEYDFDELERLERERRDML